MSPIVKLTESVTAGVVVPGSTKLKKISALRAKTRSPAAFKPAIAFEPNATADGGFITATPALVPAFPKIIPSAAKSSVRTVFAGGVPDKREVEGNPSNPNVTAIAGALTTKLAEVRLTATITKFFTLTFGSVDLSRDKFF
jgi:hypothetical protein